VPLFGPRFGLPASDRPVARSPLEIVHSPGFRPIRRPVACPAAPCRVVVGLLLSWLEQRTFNSLTSLRPALITSPFGCPGPNLPIKTFHGPAGFWGYPGLSKARGRLLKAGGPEPRPPVRSGSTARLASRTRCLVVGDPVGQFRLAAGVVPPMAIVPLPHRDDQEDPIRSPSRPADFPATCGPAGLASARTQRLTAIGGRVSRWLLDMLGGLAMRKTHPTTC